MDGFTSSGTCIWVFSKGKGPSGVIKLTAKALEFLENSISFMMTEDHNYDDATSNSFKSKVQGVSDKVLMNLKGFEKGGG